MTVALILGECLGLLLVLTVGAARGLFLAGSVGLAALGSSFAYIAKAMNEATRYDVLAVLLGIAAVLFGASLVLGYLRLHRRDLTTLLEASGWAINLGRAKAEGRAVRESRIRAPSVLIRGKRPTRASAFRRGAQGPLRHARLNRRHPPTRSAFPPGTANPQRHLRCQARLDTALFALDTGVDAAIIDS
jgi:hypothetical protein